MNLTADQRERFQQVLLAYARKLARRVRAGDMTAVEAHTLLWQERIHLGLTDDEQILRDARKELDDGCGPLADTTTPLFVPVAAILKTKLRWLWQGYLPAGHCTVLEGNGGLGKSTLLLDVAARVSTARRCRTAPHPG